MLRHLRPKNEQGRNTAPLISWQAAKVFLKPQFPIKCIPWHGPARQRDKTCNTNSLCVQHPPRPNFTFPLKGKVKGKGQVKWKESAYNAGDLDSIPGSGRSPGEGNGNPLQYSCLENPMDRGAWRATVCGVTRVIHNLVTKPPTKGLKASKKQCRCVACCAENNYLPLPQ